MRKIIRSKNSGNIFHKFCEINFHDNHY